MSIDAQRDTHEVLNQAPPIAPYNVFEADLPLREAVEREEGALAGRGRVLVRPSGTEPVVRVMVEAPSAEEATAVHERLVAVVGGGVS